ncbi:synaptogyrin-1 isoform X1 [Lates japonicus]|uniref:Synaptogyrin-1 isoform X1 n=1 Tax=Lates japonicus TaxID=270547 RepID=A0AAD3RCD4_LATJO|nr:synaptogyrin-1 isoform X1 [Lates japonicus]
MDTTRLIATSHGGEAVRQGARERRATILTAAAVERGGEEDQRGGCPERRRTMEGMQAYGAGKAGGAFDPVTFFQQPQTILRIVSWLFSIVIFGCIANEGYINLPKEGEEHCIFNHNQNACNYGVFMGSMAFLCCMAFLALDVYFPQISSVKDRKKAVLADIGVSAFWSFMWFVGFCFLANQWQVTKDEDNPLREGGDAARAAITFSFFSIFTWAGQSFLAFQRYKLGADSALFSQEYTDPSQDAAGAPYTSFGGDDLESPGGGGGQANNDGAFDGTGGYQRQDY